MLFILFAISAVLLIVCYCALVMVHRQMKQVREPPSPLAVHFGPVWLGMLLATIIQSFVGWLVLTFIVGIAAAGVGGILLFIVVIALEVATMAVVDRMFGHQLWGLDLLSLVMMWVMGAVPETAPSPEPAPMVA